MKITQMTSASALDAATLFEVVQNVSSTPTNLKATGTQLRTYIQSIIDASPGSGGGSPWVYNVLDETGVDNTGTANVRVPIQALIQRVGIAGGGTIVFPPGRYKYTPDTDGLGWCIIWDNINFEIQAGAEIFLVDPSDYMRALSSNGVGIFAIGCNVTGGDTWYRNWGYRNYDATLEGTFGSTRPPVLSVTATQGSRTMTVDAIGAVVAGDILFVNHLNDNYLAASPGQETHKTEFVEVYSVSGNVITLKDCLQDTYDITKGSVPCTPMRLVKNIAIYGGGKITGLSIKSPVGANGAGACAITVDHFFNVRIGNIIFNDHENASIKFEKGLYGIANVIDINAPRQSYAGSSTGYYGVLFSGTQNGMATGIRGRNTRHLVDTGVGRAVSRNIIFHNINANGNYTAPVSSHAVVNMIVDSVQARDCNGGILFRGVNLIATNLDLEAGNESINEGIAMGIYPTSDALASTYYGNIQIDNVQLRNFQKNVVMGGAYKNIQINNLVFKQQANTYNRFFQYMATAWESLSIDGWVVDQRGRSYSQTFNAGITFENTSSWTLGFKGPVNINNLLTYDVEEGLLTCIHGGVATRAAAAKMPINISNVRMEFTSQMIWFGRLVYLTDNMYGKITLTNVTANIFGRIDGIYELATGATLPFGFNCYNVATLRNARGRRYENYSEGQFLESDVVYTPTPSAATVFEQICVSAGTKGTLSGVTGSITSGSSTLMVNTAAALAPGDKINIAGAGPSGGFMYVIISQIVGNVVTLAFAASTTVSGAAVALTSPGFKDLTTVAA